MKRESPPLCGAGAQNRGAGRVNVSRRSACRDRIIVARVGPIRRGVATPDRAAGLKWAQAGSLKAMAGQYDEEVRDESRPFRMTSTLTLHSAQARGEEPDA